MDIKDRLARMSEKWGCCFQTIVRPGVYLGDVSFINAEEWKTMPLKDRSYFHPRILPSIDVSCLNLLFV